MLSLVAQPVTASADSTVAQAGTPADATTTASSPATWNPAPGDTLDVSLVTIGPGDIYWTRFGHNAIVVADRRDNTTKLYNYGIFDFGQDDFLLNFIRGRMQYLAVAEPFDGALDQYLHQGRSISFQRLNLSPTQRLELQTFLEWNVAPENSRYRYDYYINNCSTKVRDAIDAVLGGAVKRSLGGRSRGMTWRMQTQALTSPEPWLYLGTHLGLSGYVDRAVSFWEEAFLPMELARRIPEVVITDDAGKTMSVVGETIPIARATIAEPSDVPPNWRWRFGAAGLVLAAIVFALWRRRSALPRVALASLVASVWFACGFVGCGLLGLWTLTEHASAYANENLFVFNPAAVLLLPAVAWIARRRPLPAFFRHAALAIAGIAVVGLIVKVLPSFKQDNVDWLLLMIPFHLVVAYLMRQHARD